MHYVLPSRNKILKRRLSLLWFLDFATVYSYFNIQLCSCLILEIKSFVSLKNECCFFGQRYILRGELSSPKFWGELLRKRRSDRFSFFFFFGGGGGLGKKGWGQYFRVGLIPWRILWKGKIDTFFMSQTLVLSINLGTVNPIPYFGVTTVIMLSHRYLLQVVLVELWTFALKWWNAK